MHTPSSKSSKSPAISGASVSHFRDSSNGACRRADIQKLSWKSAKVRGESGFSAPIDQPYIDKVMYWLINEALRYNDTVELRIPFRFRDPNVGGLLIGYQVPGNGGFLVWVHTGQLKALSGEKVFVRYLPYTRQRISFVSFYFSIPKLLQGNNYQMIPSGTDFIGLLNAELAPILEQLDIPRLDISYFEFRRIDFSTVFQVGEHLNNYLDFAAMRTYPRRTREVYNNVRRNAPCADRKTNGVKWGCNSSRSDLYDKGMESKSPLARGLLRLEVSIRNAKAVQRLFGSAMPRVMDLTPQLCLEVLQKDLDILGLSNTIWSSVKLYDRLVEKFGPRAAKTLQSFILFETQFPGLSSKEAAELYHTTEKTIRFYRRSLREAGFSYWGDAALDLPRLSLEMPALPQTLADGIAGWGEVMGPNGRTCSEVPHNICSASEPTILSPTAIDCPEINEGDELASTLFGKPVILVASWAEQGGVFCQAELRINAQINDVVRADLPGRDQLDRDAPDLS